MILKQPTLTFHGLIVGKDSLVGERLGLRFGRIFMEELECFFRRGRGWEEEGFIQHFTV